MLETTSWLRSNRAFTSRAETGYTGSPADKSIILSGKSVEFPAGRRRQREGLLGFHIFAGVTEFGTAWKQQRSNRGNDSLLGKLADPSFPAPIYASLIETEGGEYALFWSRRHAAE